MGGDLFLRSTSLWATLHKLWRSLPGKVVVSKSKMACGPQHNSQHAMWPPETREFDTLELMEIYQRKNTILISSLFQPLFEPGKKYIEDNNLTATNLQRLAIFKNGTPVLLNIVYIDYYK